MNQIVKPEFKIIRLDEEEAYVTIKDLAKFSGNSEDAVQRLLAKHEEKIMEFEINLNSNLSGRNSNPTTLFKFPRHKKGANKGKISWDTVMLGEHQTMFALMLMGNSNEVIEFKRVVTTDFFRLKAYSKAITEELKRVNTNVAKALENKAQESISKDNTIKSLMSADRDYLQLTENARVYQSAEAMANNEMYKAKDFRSFVQDQNLIQKVSKITYYWRLTDAGERSPLVLSHSNSTPYYSMELKTLFEEHIQNLQNEVKEKEEREVRLAHLNRIED